MLWQVDPTSRTPLYEQLAASVRRAVVGQEVRSGERLPPAREVADALEVNLHTVLRAYQELRDEGLIELRRGRGAIVTGADPAGRTRVRELATGLVVEAKRLGVSRAELVEIVEGEF